MFFINPFKGLRPTKENASSVTIASTDHLSEDMKNDLLKKNPWSYLNVFNSYLKINELIFNFIREFYRLMIQMGKSFM